ncbi:MAG: hypothetical protein K0T99_03485 [Alphaproteobacteria bacterium]|nr:hypothetical protein [Alphaproteobacteria bacterium]
MSTSPELSIETQCLLQSALISFPAGTILSGGNFYADLTNSVGHFSACEIRKHSSSTMESENHSDIYSNAIVGAFAGIVKYTFNQGLALKSVTAGAINNGLYHLEPDIIHSINSTLGETSSLVYPYISPIIVEGLESLLVHYLFEGHLSNSFTESSLSGTKAGVIVSFFGNFLYPLGLEYTAGTLEIYEDLHLIGNYPEWA